jgi:hypothetical protein
LEREEMSANPLAPPAYAGINPQPPGGYVDVSFTYPYDVVLQALESLTDQAVAIHVDSDFAWRGIEVAVFTGAFRIRFSDSQGYYLSSSLINSGNFLIGGATPFPFPIFPELIFPAGSRVGIEIEDLSNNPNTIELLLLGAKRYRLPKS